ncbi:adenylate kinase [Brachybacterium endophyticum]|uniref:Adenylate kinase n=1 Tax=Brachybacterium endophyticum TaxID=2182385 RepID=A0A2U2RPM9_9MICO|nr:adenylate kinase [Brachybacterium endophyticum]PWH07810.1 adenylate kinase [Brachybacterium endophyticum]
MTDQPQDAPSADVPSRDATGGDAPAAGARRLLIIGAPGAGKGTQASRITEALGIPAISTGDIFRRNVSEQTELGTLAKSYMDAGEYVPDSVTNDMVRDRLAEDDAREGFLLDGYPRTLDQVTALDEILAGSDSAVDAVLMLEVDYDAVIQRLLERGAAEGRSDDTEETIRHRLEVYAEQTTPLVDVYERRGLLHRVNGMLGIDEVTDELLAVLGAR